MILVTGATGNVGGELLAQALAAGHAVRALVRSPADAKVPAGVQVVVGDLARPESLADALAGVERVFLLGGYADMPGVLAQIRAAGVQHVVLLASRSVVGGDPGNAIVAMWLASESAVQAAGVPWTIVRASGFMSNALRWLPQLRTGDVVRAPFADVPIAAIDPHDIAAVALAALTSSEHHSRAVAISGPAAMRPAEQLAVLSDVLGRTLQLVPVTDAEAKEELARVFPPAFVDAQLRFFVDGEFDDSTVVPTVQEITGRPPRTFVEWARAHANDFR